MSTFVGFVRDNNNDKLVKSIDLEVYDMLGQLVINEKNSKRLDLTSVPNGIDNLLILHKDLKITKRVIKQ